jgi:diguanylate cyclase (GGDEF)-like protein
MFAIGLRDRGRIYSALDVPGIAGWLAAGLLEIHAIVPAVGATRVVAAPVFLLLGWSMAAREAFASALVVSLWLLIFRNGTLLHATVGTSIDFAFFLSVGALARRMLPWPQAFIRVESPKSTFIDVPAASGDAANALPPVGLSPDEPFPTDLLDRLRAFAQPDEGIRRVLEGVFNLAGARSAFLAQGDPFRIIASHPPEAREIPAGLEKFAPEVVTGVRRVRIEDGPGHPPFALVPVSTSAGNAGILGVVLPAGAPWEEGIVPMLEQGAFFIGRELEMRRRIEAIYWEVDRAEGIYHLVKRISETAERSRVGGDEESSRREELFRITADSVRTQMDARRVLLIQVGPDGRGRIAWESRDDGREFRRTDAWEPLGDSYVEWIARKEEARLVNADNTLPVLPERWRETGDHGAILLPVSLPEGFLGVMACFARKGEGFLEKRDIPRGKQFLNVMRMGISHTDEVERLSTEAQRDGLTGLLNRKTFCGRLDNVLSRLDQRRTCAVIMLDIDHFKRINDGYGHPAGDEVIRTVGGVIDRTVRKGDFAGRYGGEEFVLYLEGVDRENAMQTAERLRMLIRNVKYNFAGKEIVVTSSMGVACYPEHGVRGEELLKRADEALYRSKAGGRDRVTLHDPAHRVGAI